MSVKFEVNFESLFERWLTTQYGDDIKAMTFYIKHVLLSSPRDNYGEKD